MTTAFVLSQLGSKGCVSRPTDVSWNYEVSKRYLNIFWSNMHPIQHYLSFGNADDVVTVFNKNQVMGAGFTCFGTKDGTDYYYPDNLPFNEDAIFVQKMGLATTIMGAIAWGSYILASCIRFPPLAWLLVSFLLIATCVCEGLCFTFFNAPVCEIAECGLGKSSKCSLSATVFWALSSFMTCGIFKDAQDKYNEENEQEEVGDGE